MSNDTLHGMLDIPTISKFSRDNKVLVNILALETRGEYRIVIIDQESDRYTQSDITFGPELTDEWFIEYLKSGLEYMYASPPDKTLRLIQ